MKAKRKVEDGRVSYKSGRYIYVRETIAILSLMIPFFYLLYIAIIEFFFFGL